MANTVWGIHTMNDNLFLNSNVIAIGWKAFGDLSALDATREAFKTHYEESYPEAKKEVFQLAQACYFVLFMRCKLEIMSCFLLKLTVRLILELLKENMSMFLRRMNMCNSER